MNQEERLNNRTSKCLSCKITLHINVGLYIHGCRDLLTYGAKSSSKILCLQRQAAQALLLPACSHEFLKVIMVSGLDADVNYTTTTLPL